MPDTPDKARVLYEAAEQLGWSDPKEIAKRARALERGLPAEDELSVVLFWLGRCRLVHKLEQFPYPPASQKEYRVPDLLAIFEGRQGPIPVLIEVKSQEDKVLSWRPDFIVGLEQYASTVGLPLLVAWKHRTFWTLFETRHFSPATKNMNIAFEKAMRESLLGVLAGDFSFSFREGAAINLRMRKLGKTKTSFNVVIEDAYFTDPAGVRVKAKDTAGLMLLFICVEDDALLEETEDTFLQRFVIRSSQQLEFAHRALVKILATYRGSGESLLWRQVLKQRKLPLMSRGGPKQAASRALKAGLLQSRFNIYPHTMPDFLVV
jgi:Holliday junction resolvase